MPFNFKTTFSTPFFDIEEGLDPKYPDTQPYYRLTSFDSVICCVMTMKGEFVMVRQFRPNINEYSLEFPAGGLLKNEKPIEAAKREFLEETSFSLDFIYLGDFKLMMNRTNIKEHIFFGLNPKNINQSIPEKGMEVHLVRRQDLSELSISGGYKQLAGLGIIQLASSYLGLNIMSESMEEILTKFKVKLNYES
ncbi:NUDIX hydrolase [Candidatus Pelagibacter sp.]|jgi:ADP-ribose pyrophosphatase|nr:NUDIX hydrolase [Candidatus Pelagibacter sp.]